MKYNKEEKSLIDAIYQSMEESAREARLTLGRPVSRATLQQAKEQVAMLKAAQEEYSRCSEEHEILK